MLDRGSDPLILMTLDAARNLEDHRLVDPVTADVEIGLRVLELLDDQGLESAVHRVVIAGGVEHVFTRRALTETYPCGHRRGRGN